MTPKEKLTPDEYRALLKKTRSEQPIVTSEEARRQYLEVQASRSKTLPPKRPDRAGV